MWGSMEAAAGNERVAREKFAAALHLDPSMPHTHCAWARMEAEAGNIQRAREVYQEGAECAPGHARTPAACEGGCHGLGVHTQADDSLTGSASYPAGCVDQFIIATTHA